MRVSSVSIASVQRRNLSKQNRQISSSAIHVQTPNPQPEVTFKASKIADCIAGGVCGTVTAIIATAALGPIAGAIIGVFAAKAAADAN